MTEAKTPEQLHLEVHQAVLGIPGTEDRGIVGDVKEIKEAVRAQNHRLRKNENKVWYILGMVAVLASGVGVALFHALA